MWLNIFVTYPPDKAQHTAKHTHILTFFTTELHRYMAGNSEAALKPTTLKDGSSPLQLNWVETAITFCSFDFSTGQEKRKHNKQSLITKGDISKMH